MLRDAVLTCEICETRSVFDAAHAGLDSRGCARHGLSAALSTGSEMPRLCYKLGLTGSRSVRHGAHRCWRLVALVSTVQLSLVSLKQCGYLHAGGVAVASFSLVEPHPTDESAFCDSMGSATVSRLGGLALPHLDLTDLFVSL